MATDKRSLYHLAPTQTPSPPQRKPLVQGRLETDQELSPVRATSFWAHDVSKGYSPAEERANAVSSQITTTTPQENRAITPARKVEMVTEQENPRTNPPLQYIQGSHPSLSPKAVEPSSSLSLSENDDSNSSLRGETLQSLNNLQNNLAGEVRMAEVPSETSISQFPIKVICHSPRRLKNNMDDNEVVRGFSDKASRVEVPGVTKVLIEDNRDQIKCSRMPEGNLSEESLESIRMIEGSPVDPNSTAVRVALDENDKENAEQPQVLNQYASFMGDMDGSQGGHGLLSAGLNQSNVRQQLFDYSAVIADPSNAKEDKHDKKKKKKRTTRVIPSRYMECKKPALAKPPVKKSSSLHVQTKRNVSFAPKSSRPSLSMLDSTQLNTAGHHQVTHSIKGSSKIMTSTPAVGSLGVLPSHPGGDMPEPTPILPPRSKEMSSKQVSESLAKTVGKPKKTIKTKAPLLPQKQSDLITKQKPEYEKGEVSQRQLELEYCRLLQWIFLESKLKSTFKQQEKDAQSQLYSMWQENEKLRRHLANLQLELDEKNKMEELDGQLQLQLSGLDPIGVNVPKLILEYDQLSTSLNATCQYMPVSGVLLPDQHEELLAALAESEQLLGEIETITRHQSHKTSNFAKEMEALAKLTEAEVQEQERCQELLAAASTLATQERSLTAHDIQQTNSQIYSSDEQSL